MRSRSSKEPKEANATRVQVPRYSTQLEVYYSVASMTKGSFAALTNKVMQNASVVVLVRLASYQLRQFGKRVWLEGRRDEPAELLVPVLSYSMLSRRPGKRGDQRCVPARHDTGAPNILAVPLSSAVDFGLS